MNNKNYNNQTSIDVDAVWKKYSQVLASHKVQQKNAEWHFRRAKQFTDQFKGFPGTLPTAENVVAYFKSLSTNTGLRDWQFIQIVDSVCYLLRDTLSISWAADFDWAYWRDAAQTLDSSHTTIAHELDIPEMIKQTVANVHVDLQETHGDLLYEVVRYLRLNHYAIRTEQVYLLWICRFLFHFKGRDFKSLGVTEVKAFLDYLALHRNDSMIYMHVMNTPGVSVRSPADML